MVPGGRSEFRFRLRSLGGDGTVRPDFADFDMDENGNPIASPSAVRSCAAWARADKNEVSLRAGGEAEIRVGLEIPATARGTYWCLLTLEVESPSPPPTRGDVVQVLPRLSLPLLVSVTGGSPPRLRARFEKAQAPDRAPSASILLQAEGDYAVHLSGSVTLEEVSAAGPVEIDRVLLPRSLVLPAHRRRVPVSFAPRGGKSPMRLRGSLDYEDGDPEHKTLEIESGIAGD